MYGGEPKLDNTPSDNLHQISTDTQELRNLKWRPAIPMPLYTAKGLSFWKKPFEKCWLPQCGCGRTFKTIEDYEAHVVYKNFENGVVTIAKETTE